MKQILRRLMLLATTAMLICVTLLSSYLHASADPLTPEQLVDLSQHTNWVADQCATNGVTTTVGNGITPGPIYIMGDSITKLAEDGYKKKFDDPWKPTIDGLVSRQIIGGPSLDGVDQIKHDDQEIGKANAIVIALGTNGLGNDKATTTAQVKTLMTELAKSNKQNAPVFWVNVADKAAGQDDNAQITNAAIEAGVGSDASIIDWYAAVKDPANHTGSFEEGVHPSGKDIDLLVNTVYDAVAGTAPAGAAAATPSTPDNSTGNGASTTLDKDVGASEFVDSQGYHSDNLTDSYSYAELSPSGVSAAQVSQQTATNLGRLPYKQKLAITYKGKTVVAEKLDIGQGGGPIEGKRRDIDLHYDKTVQALGVTDSDNWSGVVHVKTVSADTPLGPTTTDPSAAAVGGAADPNAAPASCCPTSDTGGSSDDASLTGSTNAEKAYNYFVNTQHQTPIVAAGIVGNMMTESGGNTEKLDTHAHNDISGTHDGIIQWSTGRWAALQQHEAGKDKFAMSTQLDYVWYELHDGGYKATLAAMQKAATASAAATEFNSTDEVSGDGSGNRENNATHVFNTYGGGASPTAGQPITSGTDPAPSGTPSCATTTTAGSSDITAYKNPFRDISKNGSLFPRRIDEGVDYGGHGPIYAMGNGVVSFAGTGFWFAAYGQSVVYKLTDGPAKDKSVYFSESCTPKVKAGDTVTPDTVICDMHGDNSPWIETGWAVGGASNEDTPSAHIGYRECATVYGANYSELLKKLGAPGGKVECGGPDETLPKDWPSW